MRQNNNTQQGGFIQYIVLIALVLGITVLSQQSHIFSGSSSGPSIPLLKKGNSSYINQAENWVKNTLYPKIGIENKEHILDGIKEQVSGGLAEKQALLAEEISTQKNNLEKSSTNYAKKIIAEKILGVLGITPQDLLESGQTICQGK